MIRFDSISAAKPDKASLAAAYDGLTQRLNAGDLAGSLQEWDNERRAFDTWSALVHLRFAQNTQDAQAKADREFADAIAPEAADLETSFKRQLLARPDRSALESAAGTHAV